VSISSNAVAQNASGAQSNSDALCDQLDPRDGHVGFVVSKADNRPVQSASIPDKVTGGSFIVCMDGSLVRNSRGASFVASLEIPTNVPTNILAADGRLCTAADGRSAKPLIAQQFFDGCGQW
jgi:hypothetical protein